MKFAPEKIECRDIDALIPYARNARTHSDAQVAQIAASIKEFGWTNPVLIGDDGGIIAGHGRVMAARKLGMKQVPCIALSHLSDTQRKAYIIADNQLPLNAGWDSELLTLELKELEIEGFDVSLTGFDDAVLADLLADKTDGLSDEDVVPQSTDIPVTQRGDVWICGNHRLKCGDSTVISDVEDVMGGDGRYSYNRPALQCCLSGQDK